MITQLVKLFHEVVGCLYFIAVPFLCTDNFVIKVVGLFLWVAFFGCYYVLEKHCKGPFCLELCFCCIVRVSSIMNFHSSVMSYIKVK